MCLWRVGVSYYLLLCRKLPHRALWQGKLCKEFLAAARYAFYFQWAKCSASNVCQRVTIKKENKIEGCISGQTCSLGNVHNLNTRSVLEAGARVVAKSGGPVLEEVVKTDDHS